jgi:predicted nuclease with TOPRIM domain
MGKIAEIMERYLIEDIEYSRAYKEWRKAKDELIKMKKRADGLSGDAKKKENEKIEQLKKKVANLAKKKNADVYYSIRLDQPIGSKMKK